MPTPPEPKGPPASFLAQDYARGLSIRIEERGFDEFIAESLVFDGTYQSEAAHIMPGITKEFRAAAQDRSPYLYGILQSAHMDETVQDGDSYMGIVRIDPGIWHPILGGRPVDYGHRIHTEDGRPWFGWTVEQEADRIINKYGADLADVYTDLFTN